MKKSIVALMLVALGVSVEQSSAGPLHRPHSGVAVSFGMFYSSLGPHGEWVACDGGIYAWRPFGVALGWRPYFHGRWFWTDDGWYWHSEEPWAWATYHYGRWYYDDFYGWVWVPGYDWAPAWVEWRYGGDYIGWAPLSPYAVFSISFGIHYRSHWITPHYWWAFVDCRHLGDPYVHRYVYRSEENTRYIGRTRSAGSVRYSGGRVVTRGPERGYVEERGGSRFERAELYDVDDRSSGRLVRESGRERIEVYRPKIEERMDETVRPERVREGGRSISFDARTLDSRAREVDREAGRDMRRAEEYRKGGESIERAPRDAGRSYEREAVPDARQEGRDRREAVKPREARPDPSLERRSESPKPESYRERSSQRAPEIRREAAPPRERGGSEWRTRRPEGSGVDRAPQGRPQQGGRGSDSAPRGGGKRR